MLADHKYGSRPSPFSNRGSAPYRTGILILSINLLLELQSEPQFLLVPKPKEEGHLALINRWKIIVLYFFFSFEVCQSKRRELIKYLILMLLCKISSPMFYSSKLIHKRVRVKPFRKNFLSKRRHFKKIAAWLWLNTGPTQMRKTLSGTEALVLVKPLLVSLSTGSRSMSSQSCSSSWEKVY